MKLCLVSTLNLTSIMRKVLPFQEASRRWTQELPKTSMSISSKKSKARKNKFYQTISNLLEIISTRIRL